jgi:hypothetical protein
VGVIWFALTLIAACASIISIAAYIGFLSGRDSR